MIPTRTGALILGSGPAGLFAADQLLRAGVPDVLVVEKGRPMPRRVCPPGPDCDCRLCDVLEGEGGAGSFSDGKITLSPTRGTHTRPLFTADQATLLDEVGATVRRFVSNAVDYTPVSQLDALASSSDMRGESYPLLHVGSDGIREFGRRYAEHLRERGARMARGLEVTALRVDGGQVRGAVIHDRRARTTHTIDADVVIAAVGMVGTPWLEQQLRDAGVWLRSGPADIGIRLETTDAALDPLIGQFYDFKATHTTATGVTLRSFCVNGGGYIVNEYHRPLGVRGVNGHSFLAQRSGLSNLAILATVGEEFTTDPKAYVRDVARAVNATTGGYPVRQTLAGFAPDLVRGAPAGIEPSNPKTRPGDLHAALPQPLAVAFTSYIAALGAAVPAVCAPDTVLYAPEIKYYNYRVPVDPVTWESTDIGGLFVVGNAAGYTASLSAAALTGIIAGRAAAQRLPVTTR